MFYCNTVQLQFESKVSEISVKLVNRRDTRRQKHRPSTHISPGYYWCQID